MIGENRKILINGRFLKLISFDHITEIFESVHTQRTVYYHLFLDAIRTNYRISKANYANFYSKLIQKTLSDCIYNEGTRKKTKQTSILQQRASQSVVISNVVQMDIDSCWNWPSSGAFEKMIFGLSNSSKMIEHKWMVPHGLIVVNETFLMAIGFRSFCVFFTMKMNCFGAVSMLRSNNLK